MQYSKIRKFIRDEAEMERVGQVLLERYGKIYEAFMYSAGSSNYPTIQWMDFTEMCEKDVSNLFLLFLIVEID